MYLSSSVDVHVMVQHQKNKNRNNLLPFLSFRRCPEKSFLLAQLTKRSPFLRLLRLLCKIIPLQQFVITHYQKFLFLPPYLNSTVIVSGVCYRSRSTNAENVIDSSSCLLIIIYFNVCKHRYYRHLVGINRLLAKFHLCLHQVSPASDANCC